MLVASLKIRYSAVQQHKHNWFLNVIVWAWCGFSPNPFLYLMLAIPRSPRETEREKQRRRRRKERKRGTAPQRPRKLQEREAGKQGSKVETNLWLVSHWGVHPQLVYFSTPVCVCVCECVCVSVTKKREQGRER